MSEAKSEPGEGYVSLLRAGPLTRVAIFTIARHPLPQGEREERAELISRKPYDANGLAA
ncbi:hypothetical protein BVIR_701 [Blastochloris viridis]|uniref:Uncharacterized protein n=1 Tax=Blastochloris viridis TaxID=1079 RepID=A0A0P0J493_BLAVI|nr:hypothetical protein BVIR_701 [Blastochloris viridis]CUU41157.1 hypothetical protein BVIRIDIS_01450 [Blastochloris viridis]